MGVARWVLVCIAAVAVWARGSRAGIFDDEGWNPATSRAAATRPTAPPRTVEHPAPAAPSKPALPEPATPKPVMARVIKPVPAEAMQAKSRALMKEAFASELADRSPG